LRNLVVCLSLMLCASARADTRVLRIATVVPEGTAWAREGKAFAREVEYLTNGEVQIKWILSAIAGDEPEVRARIARGQLDGAAFAMECYRMSPTMRVVRLLGLLQTRDEAMYLMSRLKSTIDGELQKNGFANLFEAGVGSDMVFTRAPVHSLAELAHTRIWVWSSDEVLRQQLDALGFHIAPLPVYDAARAFDEHRTDGFVGGLTAALAFQWSTQATHLLPLRIAFVEGCMVVANRAFDALSPEAQQGLRAAGAKLQARFEDLGRAQDEALLGGLLARQGVKQATVTPQLRSEFFAQALSVREKLAGTLVPKATLDRVMALLADYRGEHDASAHSH
jgi:TRAP-type C4-dicarboxylate transport system substrate-binding protein